MWLGKIQYDVLGGTSPPWTYPPRIIGPPLPLVARFLIPNQAMAGTVFDTKPTRFLYSLARFLIPN